MTRQDKDIKSHLDDVYNEILEVFPFLKDKIYFAGGSIASLVQKETPNDYDMYFFKKEYSEEFVEKLHKMISPFAYTMYVSKFAYSWKTDSSKKVQFVFINSGIPENVVKLFDFIHCQSFYNPVYKELVVNHYDTIVNKELVYNIDAEYPLKAIVRMNKFVKRDYTIEDKEIIKIGTAVSKLNLVDKDVLKKHTDGMYLNTPTQEEAVKTYDENAFRKETKYLLDDLI